MVAIVGQGESISRSFYYNENKVGEGVAKLIQAQNYPRDSQDLTQNMRLGMLTKLAALNTRTQVNSLHISLNFDPNEVFSEAKLSEIAASYMDKIGFGNQPYLVYQHFDAGHPHVHIVTTNIQANSKAINLNLIGALRSEPARKEIEIAYGLTKAEDQKSVDYELKSAFSSRAQYGKSESRKAIANVLNSVLKTYKFGSLAEFNAVLGLYNVKADRGSENSRTYKKHGLVYHILNAEGMPIGVPIKASLFYNKPTLKDLESRFPANELAKDKQKSKVRNAINSVFQKTDGISLNQFVGELKKVGIDVVLRENSDGIIYGITYVDHKNKCVFNGRPLGPDYSAKAILERCNQTNFSALTTQISMENSNKQQPGYAGNAHLYAPPFHKNRHDPVPSEKDLLEELWQVEMGADGLPYELKGRKKKRKKRKMNT
ncbi:relaxase/mobilization nuclease domain-containing protein [Taibaiella chishuiensis]|uniref:Relaxase/mobilization nuclease-like protein n=1 Tax=Taibaiella chishuiensis TaxID=1434707 RepID=A0A2P8D0W3_9BACT|nr:relaxase/mobilization nuclease domain-containing protein [Taibaiella chishuiensis]PSK90859.1 relaxase/mobilization nuclease-like protein [Taibaiella chishuiensis]